MQCYLCKNYKALDVGGVIHIVCGLSEREAKKRIIQNDICNKFEKDNSKTCNCGNCENFNVEKDNCLFVPIFENGKCLYFQSKDKQISLF